jgi:hypothetical protein
LKRLPFNVSALFEFTVSGNDPEGTYRLKEGNNRQPVPFVHSERDDGFPFFFLMIAGKAA